MLQNSIFDFSLLFALFHEYRILEQEYAIALVLSILVGPDGSFHGHGAEAKRSMWETVKIKRNNKLPRENISQDAFFT
jgi:hypothetical protein